VLKQRIITAVILAAVALWAFLGWNNFFFALFLLALTGGCAWEWSNLTSVAPRNLRIAYAAIVTITTAICMFMANSAMLAPLVLTGVIFWMVIVGDLFTRPVLPAELQADGAAKTRWPLLAIASFLLLLAVCCIFWLRLAHGPAIVIYTIALVAAADTGAYFSGRKFGKRKLAEEISGGKTIEGAAGGMLLALILSLVACRYLAGGGLSAWSIFMTVAPCCPDMVVYSTVLTVCLRQYRLSRLLHCGCNSVIQRDCCSIWLDRFYRHEHA